MLHQVQKTITLVRVYFGGGVTVSLEFKLQDMWRGVYWHNSKYVFEMWVCYVPCLPIHLQAVKQRY